MDYFNPSKTIRGTQILEFIHYMHGLNFVAKEQSIHNDVFNYFLNLMFDPQHKDKNNPNQDWELYNKAKSELLKMNELNVTENSSYNDILCSVQLVHEQSGTLSFISNHVLGLILKNLKKLHYLKRSNETNKKYNMLLLASSVFIDAKKRINQIHIKKMRYENFVEIEKTFKDDYFTGKNIISIAEELAIYIDALLTHTEFKYHSYSKNYKSLERFKLDMYTEILLDFLSAFPISENQQKEYFSENVHRWLSQAKGDYKHLDYLARIQSMKKRNKYNYNRLFEAVDMSKLWVEKIRKHAPLPEVINYIDFDSDYLKEEVENGK
ncbi:hypothetical protein HMPREF3291_01025 [Bacillus sp. HMSC76G11]|nr:hypothetical protein HMPREF3291_01025 [Bacillus sp. HMSC76G11]